MIGNPLDELKNIIDKITGAANYSDLLQDLKKLQTSIEYWENIHEVQEETMHFRGWQDGYADCLKAKQEEDEDFKPWTYEDKADLYS